MRVLSVSRVVGLVVLAVLSAAAGEAQSYRFSTLHSFTQGPSGGSLPYGRLLVDADGQLYGTTAAGGKWDRGTVYKLDKFGNNFSFVHIFSITESLRPASGLVRDAQGNLYGTTYGCSLGEGDVYRIDPQGNISWRHCFDGAHEGGVPHAGLIADADGNLYGTTYSGFLNVRGVVYKIDTSSEVLTVLHTFDGSDGEHPWAGVVMDAEGDLIGTTQTGGASSCGTDGCGTVFRMDTFGGNFAGLHNFTAPDGEYPLSDPVMDRRGNVYGTTLQGGRWGGGTIYKLDPSSGGLTVLHSFGTFQAAAGHPVYACMPGYLARADVNCLMDLRIDRAGILYGIAVQGGDCGYGTVFRVDRSGHFRVLYEFQRGSDGAWPVSLAMDSEGNLYGTSLAGGAEDAGTVFKLSPDAAQRLSNLVALIESMDLKQGIGRSLEAKLQAAEWALRAGNGSARPAACSVLTAFMNESRAQAGHWLTEDEANELTAAAGGIRSVLGCR